MSRSGYHDDCDNLAAGRWRGRVLSAIRGRRGQALLREMLAALDALPQKRLVANVLEQYTVEEDGPVPIKDGDVCTFGALGRLRGVKMPVVDGEDDDDDCIASAVTETFGTVDSLTREIMFLNDECGRGRRVPLPRYAEHGGRYFVWTDLPETPEERFVRMRAWIEKQLIEWERGTGLMDLTALNIPHLAERQGVAAALAKYNEISDREGEASSDIYAQLNKIEGELRRKHSLEVETATADLRGKLKAIEHAHQQEWEKITDYPDIDSDYQMHDDHLGCATCEITGLPLRDDDELVDWGDGNALRCVLEAAIAKAGLKP